MPLIHKVAVIPGDDAAPEAVHATLGVLDAMALPVEWVVMPDGTELGELPRAEREQMLREAIDACTTTLYGSTSGVTGGIGYLRWGKVTYANVRPVKWRTGCRSPLREPEGIDYVIVRENLEDVYAQLEGDLSALGSLGRVGMGEGRYAIKVVTREGTERITRFACRLAETRRGKVTLGTKHNVMPRSDGFFREVAAEIVRGEFAHLTFEDYLADDLSRRLVQSPHALDVVLLPNLFGDILSDEGAGTIGGLGLMPSGCYGDSYAYFESAHGSAPDISGTHTINPTATILSAAMMLEHLGLSEASRQLESAIDEVYAEGACLTPDQGGSATTEDLAAAVQKRL